MKLLTLVLFVLISGPAFGSLVETPQGTVLETSTGREWTKDGNPLKSLTFDNTGLIDAIIDAVPGRMIENSPNYWDQDGRHRLTRADFQYVSSGSLAHEWYESATWWGAQAVIAYLNKIRYAGRDDWRLPRVQPQNGRNLNTVSAFDGTSDIGYNITSPASELSHLFHAELGNRGYYKTNGVPWALPTGVVHSGPFRQVSREAYWLEPEYPLDPNQAFLFATVSGLQEGFSKHQMFPVWPVRQGQ